MDPNISQNPPPTSGVPTTSPIAQSPFQRYKKLIIAGGLLVFIVILAGAIFVLNRNGSNSSSPHNQPDPLLATIGTKKIYEDDVVREAQKSYRPEAITPDVFDSTLDVLIERELLSMEAQRHGISVTDSDIQTYKANETAKQSGQSSALPDDETIKWDLMKEKVTEKVVANRIVDRALMYKNFDDTVGMQRGRTSLTLMRSLVVSGRSMSESFNALRNSENFDTSIIVTEKMVVKEPEWGEVERKAIFGVKVGEVSSIIDIGGGTLILVKVVDGNDSTFTTYEEWLNDARSKEVKVE